MLNAISPGLLTLRLYNNGSDPVLYLVLEVEVPGVPIASGQVRYRLVGVETERGFIYLCLSRTLLTPF